MCGLSLNLHHGKVQQAYKSGDVTLEEWNCEKHTIADEQTDAFGEIRLENSNRADAKVKPILILILI